MKPDILDVVLLHEHPEYLQECAALLNKQWKRSTSARIQSLEKSYKDLPDSFLLIEEIEGKGQVVGHSRLTRVLEDPNGCWIGSVVISEDKRNRGYGRYLMQKTEEYAKELQFSTAYLNTQDQQGFYERIGYSHGDPVSSISFKWSGHIKRDIFHSLSKSDKWENMKVENNQSSTVLTRSKPCDVSIAKNVAQSAPPPPPSLSYNNFQSQATMKSNLGQYWMKKIL